MEMMTMGVDQNNNRFPLFSGVAVMVASDGSSSNHHINGNDSKVKRIDSAAHSAIKHRIAAIVEENKDDLLLTCSGMAAIFTALRLALTCHGELQQNHRQVGWLVDQ